VPARKRTRSTAAARTRRKSATRQNKTARKTTRKQTKKRTTKKRATTTTRNKVTKPAGRAAKKAKKTSRRKAKPSATSRTRATRTATKKKSTRSAKSKATTRRTSAARGTRSRGSGLSAKDLEQFRTMLLIKRAQLAGDVNTLRDITRQRGSAGDLSHMPIHMADIGSDNFEQEFTFGLIQSERALLGEINEALQRIEEGTYGICAATGKPIGKARLKAKPWAKYCYEYELELERGRARRF